MSGAEHVVIIDSSPINRRLLQVILQKEGFETTATNHAMEAFPLVVERQPSLVVMDLALPGIDGLELCHMLKTNNITQHIPIIVISSRTRGADVMNALEAGAFDFIKKPIDQMEVLARVRSALRQRSYEKQLLDMAVRDSLTNLYNHGLIMELLGKELYNSFRRQRPLVFVMIDVDHFKSINDNFGHQAGDSVLKGLAKLLEETLRRGDYLGRYGGEEFAMVFPGLDRENGALLCERLRKKVEEFCFVHDDTTIPVTISMGAFVAGFEREWNAKEVVLLADKALYTAKESGRNRVEWS